MPTPNHDSLPDIGIGHHPRYGIVAANPKELPAADRLLKAFDFHPVPGHPTIYVLADQDRDGHDRTTRAVDLLRRWGYRVEADAAFEPSPPPTRQAPSLEPDVAFGEHPRLGIVAATADTPSALTGRPILEDHGWQHDPALDIYTLPATIERGQALDQLAAATLAMLRANLLVAVEPHLAQNTATRRSPAPPSTRTPRARGSMPAPATRAPGPVDPRAATSRHR